MLTLHVLRTLLKLRCPRAVVAQVEEKLPVPDEDTFFGVRLIADFGWWCMSPMYEELLRPLEGVDEGTIATRIFDNDVLEGMIAEHDHMWRSDDGFVFAGEPGDSYAVWLPLSTMAAELVEKADQWRRQRRISMKHWPVWM